MNEALYAALIQLGIDPDKARAAAMSPPPGEWVKLISLFSAVGRRTNVLLGLVLFLLAMLVLETVTDFWMHWDRF